MEKRTVEIEVDEDIEAEFRLNLANWLEDFNSEDLTAGKIRLIAKKDLS